MAARSFKGDDDRKEEAHEPPIFHRDRIVITPLPRPEDGGSTKPKPKAGETEELMSKLAQEAQKVRNRESKSKSERKQSETPKAHQERFNRHQEPKFAKFDEVPTFPTNPPP